MPTDQSKEVGFDVVRVSGAVFLDRFPIYVLLLIWVSKMVFPFSELGRVIRTTIMHHP